MAIPSDVACYIPAKGASGGVASKNLRRLGSSTLVEISVMQAMAALGDPSRIFVSTESAAVSDIVSPLGVRVIRRPEHLARDEATVADCLRNDIARIVERVGTDGMIAVLLPTNPFRSTGDIVAGISKLAARPEAASLVAVSEYPCPIGLRLGLDRGSDWLDFEEGDAVFNRKSRRQQHHRHYYPNGCLYVVRTAFFEEHGCFFFDGKTLGLEVSMLSSFDIDSEEHLEIAHRLKGHAHGSDRSA